MFNITSCPSTATQSQMMLKSNAKNEKRREKRLQALRVAQKGLMQMQTSPKRAPMQNDEKQRQATSTRSKE
jgi:hypothetical protein